MTEPITTWAATEAEEAMAAGHAPAWNAIIEAITETNLQDKKILDFGCNRGGFLRALARQKPYREAVGVDIAVESVTVAECLKGNLPITYGENALLKAHEKSFDLAFSHEVIYLLPDLAVHAREIKRVLKPGGVYYLAIGEYVENPLWARWKIEVEKFSPVSPHTYSLGQIAGIFADEGYSIGLKRLNYKDFIAWEGPTNYMANPTELLCFMYDHMVLFQLKTPEH